MTSHTPAQEKYRFITAIQPETLRPGANFFDEEHVIVFKDSGGGLRAIRNRCRHQGGRFRPDSLHDNRLTCPRHGWTLDLVSMQYVAPTGGLAQPQLKLEPQADGTLHVFEEIGVSALSGPGEKSTLTTGELTVTFMAHACICIHAGKKLLVTDPWLTGPAFARGWWLAHQPPPDWLDTLAGADAIYISHSHPDHLNGPTLKLLARKNPQVPVYVPDYGNESCAQLVKRAGMTDVRMRAFDQWIDLGDGARFMIVADGSGRYDSGLFFDYNGHTLLNAVDCADVCAGSPPRADMLFTSFSTGASGYPVCWPEQYAKEEIEKIVAKRRSAKLLTVAELVTAVQPRLVGLIASYFTEAHPADADIKALNKKNTAQEVEHFLNQRFGPAVQVWSPRPGEVLDGCDYSVDRGPVKQPDHIEYQFSEHLVEIEAAMGFKPLQAPSGLEEYFRWAGFKGNLVLHVLETDENYDHVLREFMYDFAAGRAIDARPQREHRYLRMRVRADVFRYVCMTGAPWEDISIGFQARFYREPDVYNYEFWHHFQNCLPAQLPWRPRN